MKITHVFVRCQNRSQSVRVSRRNIERSTYAIAKNVHGIWIKPNLSSKRFIFEIKNILKKYFMREIVSDNYFVCSHLFNLRLFQLIFTMIGTTLYEFQSNRKSYYVDYKSIIIDFRALLII